MISLGRNEQQAQIDITTAFLQTDSADARKRIKGDTYIRVPKEVKELGVIGKDAITSRTVLKVLKSLYGLRTAPKAWKETLERFLHGLGYENSLLDDTILINRKNGTRIFLYVDDLLMCGDEQVLKDFLTKLTDRFDCTAPNWLKDATEERPMLFLGNALWVAENKGGQKVLHISQEEYITQMLSKLEMQDCRPLSTLNPDDFDKEALDSGTPLSPDLQTKLRGVLGALLYLAGGTRPDLLTPVAKIAEGQSQGTSKHLEAAKKVVRYVMGTRDMIFKLAVKPLKDGEAIVLDAFFDASFGFNRARMGGTICINDAVAHFWSKKQKSICLSTAEAELVAASQCGRELIGFRNAIREVWPEYDYKLRMHGDNRATNLIASKACSLRKVRHLSLADLYIREICSNEQVEIFYVASNFNPADCLTKILSRQKIVPLFPLLGLFRRGDPT